MGIYYGQITRREDFKGTLRCVKLVYPYVDAIIIVEHDFTSNEINKLESIDKENKIHIVHHEWHDSFPDKRNEYLEKAKELAELNNDPNPWMLVSDADEFFNEEFLKDLRAIVDWLTENGYDMAGINCREKFECVEWLDELDLLKEVPGGYRESNYYKYLLFRLYPDLKYIGVGVSRAVHETFNRKNWRAIHLPKDKYWYTHEKSALRIWLNAARNFFAGGGGDNVGELNPYWKPFRDLCARYGIRDSEDFLKALKEGLPREIEDKLIEFLQPKPIFATDYGREMREAAKAYFALHPDKITPEIQRLLKTTPPRSKEVEVEDYIRKMYFKILGRHPDRGGLEYYKKAILEGLIRKEDLPKLLMSSSEYKEKFALERESVRVQIPVNVDVQLNDEIVMQALMKSRVWFDKIKPYLDIGRFILDNIVDRDRFISWFYRNKNDISIEEFISVVLSGKKGRER